MTKPSVSSPAWSRAQVFSGTRALARPLLSLQPTLQAEHRSAFPLLPLTKYMPMNAKSKSPFNQLHHVCIVVRDLDKAVACYESLGVGPWAEFPSLEAFRSELKVPDVEAFMGLRFRWCNLENIQLQLCEPGPGGSPQRAFLDQHGEGVFHLGFTVADLDASEADAGKLGQSPWMRGRLPDRSGFTYFDTRDQGAGVTLEIRANRRG